MAVGLGVAMRWTSTIPDVQWHLVYEISSATLLFLAVRLAWENHGFSRGRGRAGQVMAVGLGVAMRWTSTIPDAQWHLVYEISSATLLFLAVRWAWENDGFSGGRGRG